jgi:hypothetical protein
MISFRRNTRTGDVAGGLVDEAGMSTDELVRTLADRRDRDEAQRRDELTRTEAEAGHRRDRADLGVRTRIEDLAREERVAEALSAARIARTYREAMAAGERMRIESQMRRSGEARSLTLERLRSLNIKVLVPVLVAFGAWSTAGVQDGAARLMGIRPDSVMWWVLWLLEPALLGAVAWIITARARLASAGGRLEHRAELVGVGCLSTSVVLNVVAALPEHTQHLTTTVGDVFAHIVGPIGAAVTAYLLGVVDRSITAADPWRDAPSLAEMDLRPPQISLDSTVESALAAAPKTASEGAVGVAAENASDAVDSTARESRRTAGEQDGRTGSEALSRPRPNRGHRVPDIARGSAGELSPRAATDEDLMVRLTARIAAGELSDSPSIRNVQDALGLGFNRAKRVMELAGLPLAGEAQDRDDDTSEVAA